MGPHRTRALLATALLAIAAGCATSSEPEPRPFLYRIHGTPGSYLFGTIHLPDARVLNQPPAVWEALESSKVLYTEVRISGSTLVDMPQQETPPPLRERVPPDLYERIQNYLRARGATPARFEFMELWAVSNSLPLIDYLGSGQPALDFYLAQRAQAAGLQLAGLETAQEQIDVLQSRDEAAELSNLELVLSSLEADLEAGIDPLEIFVQAYLSGDAKELTRVMDSFIGPSDAENREFYNRLIEQRSDLMTERIAKILGSELKLPNFFAVGAFHVVGPHNIVDGLRARGFRVDRVR